MVNSCWLFVECQIWVIFCIHILDVLVYSILISISILCFFLCGLIYGGFWAYALNWWLLCRLVTSLICAWSIKFRGRSASRLCWFASIINLLCRLGSRHTQIRHNIDEGTYLCKEDIRHKVHVIHKVNVIPVNLAIINLLCRLGFVHTQSSFFLAVCGIVVLR